MLPGPAYVISDSHLGFATPDVERELLAFLKHLPGRAGCLVINGDLFEFWFEWRHVMPRRSFRVLAALADLRDAGVPVLMVAGNHDCWGGEILRDDVGLAYQLEPWEGELASWRARVDHGDGLRDREDRWYRALRAVFRNRLSIALFRLLHPDLGTALAAGTSTTSRSYQARDGGAGLRAVACKQLGDRPGIDLLVLAHSHVPALERVGTAVYANAGAWLDGRTFLRVEPARIELRRWDGSADGALLEALDRHAG